MGIADHADRLHDALANEYPAQQARVEGILDGPLLSAVREAGPASHSLTGPVGCLLLLNYVGRFLREAYGREGFERSLRVALADLYAEGERAGAAHVAGETQALSAALQAGSRRWIAAGAAVGIVGSWCAFALMLALGFLKLGS